MTNPSNSVVLMGAVMTEPQFVQSKAGVEFAAKFMLSVKKGYKNKNGFYTTDLIPVRIKGEKRMGFARMIHKDDKVCLSGTVSAERFALKSGESVFSVLIDADYIEWTSKKVEAQKAKPASESMYNSANNKIMIELPFD